MNPKPYIFFNGTARAAIASHVGIGSCIVNWPLATDPL